MLTRKVWDHAINLKETFKLWKGRIYPLSKDEREEVQNFVEDQLRKGYIRLSQTSFGHISINSSSILTVSVATESP